MGKSIKNEKKRKRTEEEEEEKVEEQYVEKVEKRKAVADSDDDNDDEVKQQRKQAKKQEKKSKKSKKREADFEERPVSDDDDDDGDDHAKETAAATTAKEEDDDDTFDLSSLKRNGKPASSSSSPSTSSSSTNASTTTTASAPEGITRAFLGNLPFAITDELVHEHFDPCGEIVGIHWVTDKTTGKFYGTAFIDFDTPEAVAKAVKLNGVSILNRPIKVGVATGNNTSGANRFNQKMKKGAHLSLAPISEKPRGTKTVFLGNLPFTIEESTLRQVFSKCGEITQIRWVERDGEFKGCGFIEFSETKATDLAVKLNGRDINGRAIRVDYSSDRQQAGAAEEM